MLYIFATKTINIKLCDDSHTVWYIILFELFISIKNVGWIYRPSTHFHAILATFGGAAIDNIHILCIELEIAFLQKPVVKAHVGQSFHMQII